VEPDHSVAAAEATYTVHVGASLLTWKPEDNGTSTAHVEILAVSRSRQGKPLAHTLHGATATARAGINVHDPQRVATFEFTTTAAAKAVTLRFVVRDQDTGRMGSFDLPIGK
jgi:hypothetical protein